MFLEILQNSLENICASLFNKVAGLRPEACNCIKKETPVQLFSCEFCEISKNTFFTEPPWTTASVVLQSTVAVLFSRIRTRIVQAQNLLAVCLINEINFLSLFKHFVKTIYHHRKSSCKKKDKCVRLWNGFYFWGYRKSYQNGV